MVVEKKVAKGKTRLERYIMIWGRILVAAWSRRELGNLRNFSRAHSTVERHAAPFKPINIAPELRMSAPWTNLCVRQTKRTGML